MSDCRSLSPITFNFRPFQVDAFIRLRLKPDLVTLSHLRRNRLIQEPSTERLSQVHPLIHREQILLTFREENVVGLVNPRDISQTSFSPIQSEIFASQKQSHLKCKDGKHNYNNYITSPNTQKYEATLQKTRGAGTEELKDSVWKSNHLYF